ncbi:MAG TPA: hypothetical protein V6C88_21310 [Chroococcidiopsis sp.]
MARSKIPADILISLATGPMLLTLVGGRVLGALMINLGQASEELFRGDRLPILHVPAVPDAVPESPADTSAES